ncbi:MAG TPA: hypothetical protein DCL40_00365 [Coxiellaceae bacterium]|nr:hypothetical protein [Coxiellaceae bacterium]
MWYGILLGRLADTRGEYLRRFCHIACSCIPVFYFLILSPQLNHSEAVLHQLLLSALAVILMLDGARVAFGVTVIGQRDYEQYRYASLTGLLVGMILVLWWAPYHQLAIAIILTATLVDPVMGIMRRCDCSVVTRFVVGVGLVILLWVGVGVLEVISMTYIFMLAVLAVFIENYQLTWLDDNLLVQVIPLGVVLMIIKCN